jgi:hypothetical protein
VHAVEEEGVDVNERHPTHLPVLRAMRQGEGAGPLAALYSRLFALHGARYRAGAGVSRFAKGESHPAGVQGAAESELDRLAGGPQAREGDTP